MSAHFSCNSFTQISWLEYQQNLQHAITQEVHGRPKEYILGVDEKDYKSYLVRQYTLEALEIVANSEHIDTPRTERSNSKMPLIGLATGMSMFSACVTISLEPRDCFR